MQSTPFRSCRFTLSLTILVKALLVEQAAICIATVLQLQLTTCLSMSFFWAEQTTLAHFANSYESWEVILYHCKEEVFDRVGFTLSWVLILPCRFGFVLCWMCCVFLLVAPCHLGLLQLLIIALPPEWWSWEKARPHKGQWCKFWDNERRLQFDSFSGQLSCWLDWKLPLNMFNLFLGLFPPCMIFFSGQPSR